MLNSSSPIFDHLFRFKARISICCADGAYLTEVDRILRPGGYWILSGPPIRWKKYWKGWERSREDLNAEQMQIENVTRNLCWKKLVEKDDIAIWQKPINHLECKSENLCSGQDSDRAWFELLIDRIQFFQSQICFSAHRELTTDSIAGIRIWRLA